MNWFCKKSYTSQGFVHCSRAMLMFVGENTQREENLSQLESVGKALPEVRRSRDSSRFATRGNNGFDAGCSALLEMPVSVQEKIAFSARPMPIAATTVTRPGRMKLWLSRYFPILVVPV